MEGEEEAEVGGRSRRRGQSMVDALKIKSSSIWRVLVIIEDLIKQGLRHLRLR